MPLYLHQSFDHKLYYLSLQSLHWYWTQTQNHKYHSLLGLEPGELGSHEHLPHPFVSQYLFDLEVVIYLHAGRINIGNINNTCILQVQTFTEARTALSLAPQTTRTAQARQDDDDEEDGSNHNDHSSNTYSNNNGYDRNCNQKQIMTVGIILYYIIIFLSLTCSCTLSWKG